MSDSPLKRRIKSEEGGKGERKKKEVKRYNREKEGKRKGKEKRN